MKRIMFVCHGNICRSPMAEIIFRHMVTEQGQEGAFVIASSATSTEELGNPVYPPARAELAKHGLSCEGKRSVQLQKKDYDQYDLFVCMDSNNVRNAMRIFGCDPEKKLCRLMDFTPRGGDVADPWFYGNFDITYRDVSEGCASLLKILNT